ncbi:MAG: hypothetical protein N3F67_01360 [Acidilobaceae archaeon]|nr:hypothetical protein [Acidilobaceae archaeon]
MKCDLCGARAVFYRTSSGHRLCLRCLERALERAVRRRLSRLRVLAPGSRVLVPITCYNPLSSLGLALLSSQMRRGYKSEVVAAIPSSVEARIEGVRAFKVRVSPRHKKGYLEAFLYDRAWSVETARKAGFGAVLFPLTATESLLLTLEALLSEREGVLPLLREVREEGGVIVVNALLSVEASAITSYAALKGLDGRCLEAEWERGPKGFMRTLRGLGPEVEFAHLRLTEAWKVDVEEKYSVEVEIEDGV